MTATHLTTSAFKEVGKAGVAISCLADMDQLDLHAHPGFSSMSDSVAEDAARKWSDA